MVKAVLSGGQTGADQGGLRAARAAGLRTGGWAPRGWLVEAWPDPGPAVGAAWLASWGLLECPRPEGEPPPRAARSPAWKSWEAACYRERRRANVRDCHGVLLFGNPMTAGSRGLAADCRGAGRELFHVAPGVRPSAAAAWLEARPGLKYLLVAGNRESSAPGIGDRVARFLGAVFRMLSNGRGDDAF